LELLNQEKFPCSVSAFRLIKDELRLNIEPKDVIISPKFNVLGRKRIIETDTYWALETRYYGVDCNGNVKELEYIDEVHWYDYVFIFEIAREEVEDVLNNTIHERYTYVLYSPEMDILIHRQNLESFNCRGQ